MEEQKAEQSKKMGEPKFALLNGVKKQISDSMEESKKRFDSVDRELLQTDSRVYALKDQMKIMQNMMDIQEENIMDLKYSYDRLRGWVIFTSGWVWILTLWVWKITD